VPVVTYINSYAEVKAECDICCTSSNAAKVLASLDGDTVIFIPDEYLSKNVAKECGKEIIVHSRKDFNGHSEKQNGSLESSSVEGSSVEGSSVEGSSLEVIAWEGKCEVHEKFTVEDITNARKQFPDVVVLAHPECSPEVVMAADYSGSTSKMIDYVRESDSPHYLILTECSMGDNIIAENPDKEILRLCSVRCPHMNQITLEGVIHALRNNERVIEVPEDISVRARRSVERMLEIG